MTVVWLATAFLLSLAFSQVNGLVKCPPPPPKPIKVDDSVFDYGDPVILVTTSSQNFSPYSMVDVYRRTSVEEEYLMVGYQSKIGNETLPNGQHFEKLQMVMYDRVKMVDANADDVPDLVHQNLEKELYWKYFNSTGIMSQITIVNMTTRRNFRFEAGSTDNKTSQIAFTATLKVLNISWEPQLPYTAVLEIPSNSRVLRKEMTLIEYQSFTLWRWKLSNTVKTWPQITSETNDYDDRPTSTHLYKIDNPCIKDMFLVYAPRSDKGNPDKKRMYLASPLIQTHFRENFFYDLNTAEHPWAPDTPDSIVLTNDHLVVLTKTSMWISASLNNTPDDLMMKVDYMKRPTLTYVPVNPCDLFEDTIDCFKPEDKKNMSDEKVYTKHRLFYNPTCYLYQFPFYDDFLIFTTERTRTAKIQGKNRTLKDFTVMFAKKPYNIWNLLFSNVGLYKTYETSDSDLSRVTVKTIHIPITNIIGIFFNHHRRHFDLCLELSTPTKEIEYVRFVLPEPTSIFDGYGVPMSKDRIDHHVKFPISYLKELNSTLGDGFSAFKFPSGFELTDVLVSGDTLDLFFVGNQLWIAEAAGTSIYLALSYLHQPIKDGPDNNTKFCEDFPKSKGRIKECSFNHPDKTFVCTSEDRRLLVSGKTGSQYTLNVFEMERVEELINAQRVNPWPMAYYCQLLQTKSIFVASFSGRIVMWFLQEPDEEKSAVEKAMNGACSPEDEPELCDDFTKWKGSCKVEKSGKPGFRLVVIDPRQLTTRHDSCDGALVPFLVDANTAVLYEAIVPPDGKANYAYFDETYVGRKIYCNNYELLKVNANDELNQTNCELFVRHIKPVEPYLDGFKKSVYVTIVRSIPLLPVPVDVVVLVFPNSNRAFVRINDGDKLDPAWIFTKEHIGQTLYIPGNFSMLLKSFPVNDSVTMSGYITRHFQHKMRFVFHAFRTYLMDLSTKKYRERIENLTDEALLETKNRRDKADEVNLLKWQEKVAVRKAVQKKWEESDFADKSVQLYPNLPDLENNQKPKPTEVLENEDLTTTAAEKSNLVPGAPVPWKPRDLGDPNLLVHGNIEYNKKLLWYVAEDECHYILSLVHNPLLKTSGGRISLDIYDRISFEIVLQPLTALGKLLMYRPLLDVTNSNSKILRVEMQEKLRGSPQFIQFLLSPTGYGKGTAVVTVRSRVNSLKCPYISSFTLIVLCHRDIGRRLRVVYPVPHCKPEEEYGLYPYPRYVTSPISCVTTKNILEKHEIKRTVDGFLTQIYENLPVNYRPPALDGESAPQSRNVYNADPSQPGYNDLYAVSRESMELGRCAGASKKSECRCDAPSHRVSDDEEFSECKEKAYLVIRAEPVPIKIWYDRIMRDQDQNSDMFLPKRNWSVTIEEVNGREEWFITSNYSPYINKIHMDVRLHHGQRFYDMTDLSVRLVGTGLFHFKVRLANWETFDPVIGYFMLFSRNEELNHIHMTMLVLGTLIACVTCVFIGFIVNRKRLSAMLPIQPMSHKRKLKLM